MDPFDLISDPFILIYACFYMFMHPRSQRLMQKYIPNS